MKFEPEMIQIFSNGEGDGALIDFISKNALSISEAVGLANAINNRDRREKEYTHIISRSDMSAARAVELALSISNWGLRQKALAASLSKPHITKKEVMKISGDFLEDPLKKTFLCSIRSLPIENALLFIQTMKNFSKDFSLLHLIQNQKFEFEKGIEIANSIENSQIKDEALCEMMKKFSRPYSDFQFSSQKVIEYLKRVGNSSEVNWDHLIQLIYN